MSINKYLHIIIYLVALSCGNNQGKESQGDSNEPELSENDMASIEEQHEDSLYNVVMGIHDEIMPKMQDIFNMKTILKDKLSIREVNSDSIQLIIEELEQAEERMMDWMRSFRPDQTLGHDSLMQYYRSEKKKIEKVKDEMEISIEKAKTMQ